MKPDSCIEVLYQGLKIIRTFCESQCLRFDIRELVLMLDLIHAALKSDDTDMIGFGAEALSNLIKCENDSQRSNGQMDNLLAGLTEDKGILHTVIDVLNNVEKKNLQRKAHCADILVSFLEAVSPEIYPHVLRLFKPLSGLISCTRSLSFNGTTTDLNFHAYKCLSLLVPHCKNFRIYLDDEVKFIRLTKNIYECAAVADLQNFAKIILDSMGVPLTVNA